MEQDKADHVKEVEGLRKQVEFNCGLSRVWTIGFSMRGYPWGYPRGTPEGALRHQI